MKLIRYMEDGKARLAIWTEDAHANVGGLGAGVIHPTPYHGLMEFIRDARKFGLTPLAWGLRLQSIAQPLSDHAARNLVLTVPVEAEEVWAAGVTYERSREARNYEATGGRLDASTFYDKVYDAQRPELFFKATAARLVEPGGVLCIRSDSDWQIPEPELALVIDRKGEILGYTIGNDMSCRDIEGENPLYLPQAKMWRRSCSIGPSVLLRESVENPYNLQIVCRIYRDGHLAVEGQANTSQLIRKYDELVTYLVRDNQILDGTVLLTGTCIVPPNEFTLKVDDRVEIEITGIGTLVNHVRSTADYE